MHKIEDFLGLRILNIENESIEVIERLLGKENYDLVNIINPGKEALEKFKDFIYRPLKITYVIDVVDIDTYLKSLTRKRRKWIYRARRAFEDFELIKEEKISDELFLEWFKIYKENIKGMNIGVERISENKFREKKNMAGIFLKKGRKMMGGVLLTKKKDSISISFIASKQEFFRENINEFLYFSVILFAKELNYSKVEMGIESNLYGHHLSLGLYLFKKSFGFRVEPKEKYGRVLTKIVNFDKFNDVFMVGFDDGLVGYLFRKSKDIDTERFKADFLKEVKVIDVSK